MILRNVLSQFFIVKYFDIVKRKKNLKLKFLTCNRRDDSSILCMVNSKFSYDWIIHDASIICLVCIPPPVFFVCYLRVSDIGPLFPQKTEHATCEIRMHCPISCSNPYHNWHSLEIKLGCYLPLLLNHTVLAKKLQVEVTQ